jgi:RND family efflux transporter MFP subunit
MSTSEMKETEGLQKETAPLEPASQRGLSRWLLIGLGVAVVLLAVGIYSGIHTRTVAATRLTDQAERSSAVPVSVMYPKSTTTGSSIVLPGNTQPYIEAPIYARTNGYLKHWYVDIGAHVHQGELLADIETPEIDQQLAQARAELKSSQANLQLAKITAARWQNLLKTNSVSKQETDQAVSDLSAKEAAVDSSTANVHRLEQLQSFEKIYAPFDGIITARNTDIGALIDAGAGSTPRALFTLAAVNKLRVYVSVPEIYAGAAKSGATTTLTFAEFPGQEFHGTIVRNADAIDLNSRTLNVEVDVNNGDGRIKPGSYAMVHLNLPENQHTEAASVTVPSNTLLFRSEGLRVAVVQNNRAELRPVTIGRDFGDTVEVISGLRMGDSVILNPSDSLIDGTLVQVTNPRPSSGEGK